MIYVIVKEQSSYEGTFCCNLFASTSKDIAEYKLEEFLEKQKTVNEANKELWNYKESNKYPHCNYNDIIKWNRNLDIKIKELANKYNLNSNEFLLNDDYDYLIEEVESD